MPASPSGSATGLSGDGRCMGATSGRRLIVPIRCSASERLARCFHAVPRSAAGRPPASSVPLSWMGWRPARERWRRCRCASPGDRIRSRPGVHLLRSQLDDTDIVVVDGIPVTSPVRTVYDIGRGAGGGWRGLPSLRRLMNTVADVDATLRDTRTGAEAVARYCAARPHWRGTPLLQRVLGLADPRAASRPESAFRVVWIVAARMPRPKVNWPIYSADGQLLAIVDVLDEEAGLAGEYDGADHRRLDRHARDNVREEVLESHNLVIVRATSIDLYHRPVESLVSRITSGRRRGLARDRGRDRRAGSGSRRRARAPGAGVVGVAQVRRHRPRPARRGRRRCAAPMAAVTAFDFGAVARWITAWARLSCASGRPTYSTACAAAVATVSAVGSAMPTSSLAKITIRRAMNRGVLAGDQHPGQPVQRGVHVRAAHALDERADHVVVLRRRPGRSARPPRRRACSAVARSIRPAPARPRAAPPPPPAR